MRRLDSLGITGPLPIQAAAIPPALAGRDVCGQAPTGSGKTLAFGIPLVSGRSTTSRGPGALVLVPTRELADQVREALAGLMDAPDRVVALYGGTGYGAQLQALRRGVDIAVGCPGRLEDLVARGDLRLGGVRTVVIDEADRMVDMGFVRPVCRLVDQTAAGRQVLLFSATMAGEVDAIGRRYQRDPARVEVRAEPVEVARVAHHFWRVPRPERVQVTAELVGLHGQAFVFCRTKHAADRVTRQLRAAGVAAAPIHGDRSQPERTRALAGFASGRTAALVATDVVARGIHVDDVPCVVHFDPPGDADSYVHRSGRTGRAGAAGMVVSLVPDELQADVKALQRALGFPAGLTTPFSEGPPPAAPVAPPTPARPGAGHGPAGRVSAPARRLNGTVKFFDSRRGYGFLAAPDGSEVYVHHTKLQAGAAGRRRLRQGEPVVFELVEGRRGKEAANVAVTQEVAS